MTTNIDSVQLGQLGERAILDNFILPRFSTFRSGVTGIGDDCAEIGAPPEGHTFVMTTDPCPTPLVFDIADRDYWHFGWMTMLINLSDLAAMGATPTGIVVSTVMPNEMLVSEYQRFLDGLSAAADEWDCPVVGGNIKDGDSFTATGTAIGVVRRDRILRRVGARPGDLIFVVGEMGLFWAALLRLMYPARTTVSDSTSERLDHALHHPVPRVREGRILGDAAVVSACMDASDGVSGCLRELAYRNNADFIIDADLLEPSAPVAEVARSFGMEPGSLMLSWGNWELVLTVPRPRLAEFHEVTAAHRIPYTRIGEVRPGPGQVLLETGGRTRPLTNLASERFTPTSYFTHGIEAYAQWLLQQPLTESDQK
ncbi:thiamine-phosphate kinase [Sphaerisporangium sp. NPDC049002]|uniref:thiamine-phosphate kinase n=1 Tax=Sphaerisporangium sp. NPDC049002 TaxID=3155392 RepID=UPI0033EE7D99